MIQMFALYSLLLRSMDHSVCFSTGSRVPAVELSVLMNLYGGGFILKGSSWIGIIHLIQFHVSCKNSRKSSRGLCRGFIIKGSSCIGMIHLIYFHLSCKVLQRVIARKEDREKIVSLRPILRAEVLASMFLRCLPDVCWVRESKTHLRLEPSSSRPIVWIATWNLKPGSTCLLCA